MHKQSSDKIFVHCTKSRAKNATKPMGIYAHCIFYSVILPLKCLNVNNRTGKIPR